MNGIRLAFRSLFKRGRNNIIKILSLAVGLALGIVMIAKVCFESSFDRGGKDEERIYIVKEKASSKGEEHDRTYSQSSGAVGAALRKEIPQVEDATRLTFFMGDGSTIYTVPDNRMIIVNGADAAEPNVFDFIGSRMLVGDSSLLNDRKCVLVSRRVAEKFGGVAEAVGKQFKSEDFGGIYTVSGVFENIPENSSRQFDMLFSLKVMGDWSLNNWIGNDRYITLARLAKGTDAGSLQPTIDRMLAAHISPEEAEWMSKAGISLQYSLHRYDKEYSGQKDVRNSVTMLSLLAFLLIFTALMNYILIVLSTMASRTKEVAVEKCYGATGREVLGIFTAEAALHVVLSLIVAFLLVLAFKGEIEVLVGASLTSIFTVRMLGIILLVALVIFIATSVIPAYIYAKVPVAAAFRGYKSSRRNWKLGLLFVQFCATAVLVSLLAVISRQYDVMVNDDTGYSYQNLEYYDSPRVLDSSRFATMIKETAKMPEVASVTSCCNLPIEGLSGNDVSLPAGSASSEEFNVADFYFVGDGFFSTMGIPVVEGRAFDDDAANDNLVMVSRSCSMKLAAIGRWTDGTVGKQICVTEHSGEKRQYSFTICGVYEDIKMGTAAYPDTRPSVIFPYNGASYMRPHIMLVRLKQKPDRASVGAVISRMKEIVPDTRVELDSYAEKVRSLYASELHFRNAVLLGGIVTLILALIGLLGYVYDEASSRGREIAIRKVNGATSSDISSLFARSITFVSVPAVIVGVVVSWFVSRRWLTGFALKTELSPLIFILSAAAVYAVIIGTLLLCVRGIAARNPSDNLKRD